MPNIKFSYLYRDGANYKSYGFVVFQGLDHDKLDYLQELIIAKLIDQTWFYADEWQLPDLHFDTWNNKFDHTFHEFECIEYTNEPPNTLITLAQFKAFLERTI